MYFMTDQLATIRIRYIHWTPQAEVFRHVFCLSKLHTASTILSYCMCITRENVNSCRANLHTASCAEASIKTITPLNVTNMKPFVGIFLLSNACVDKMPKNMLYERPTRRINITIVNIVITMWVLLNFYYTNLSCMSRIA